MRSKGIGITHTWHLRQFFLNILLYTFIFDKNIYSVVVLTLGQISWTQCVLLWLYFMCPAALFDRSMHLTALFDYFYAPGSPFQTTLYVRWSLELFIMHPSSWNMEIGRKKIIINFVNQPRKKSKNLPIDWGEGGGM